MTDYQNFYRNRRVLITGGLGFIGSNLARRLVALGADVLLVDSLVPEYGGGALWDVGVYPLSFAQFIMGEKAEWVFGDQRIGRTGVDMTFTGIDWSAGNAAARMRPTTASTSSPALRPRSFSRCGPAFSFHDSALGCRLGSAALSGDPAAPALGR